MPTTTIYFENTENSHPEIPRAVTVQGQYVLQNTSLDRFAKITLLVEPQYRHPGCDFSWEVDEDTIPFEYFDSVLSAVKSAIREWSKGDSLRLAAIRVVGGAHHKLDSCPMTFRFATEQAMMRALIELDLVDDSAVAE